jgi:hypothetical protein
MMQIAVYDFGLHDSTNTLKDQLSRILKVRMMHFEIMYGRWYLKLCLIILLCFMQGVYEAHNRVPKKWKFLVRMKDHDIIT